jgi:hypothetical protein
MIQLLLLVTIWIALSVLVLYQKYCVAIWEKKTLILRFCNHFFGTNVMIAWQEVRALCMVKAQVINA